MPVSRMIKKLFAIRKQILSSGDDDRLQYDFPNAIFPNISFPEVNFLNVHFPNWTVSQNIYPESQYPESPIFQYLKLAQYHLLSTLLNFLNFLDYVFMRVFSKSLLLILLHYINVQK